MKKDILARFEKEEAERLRQLDREIEANPLVQYSTTQLKRELRRRKKELEEE